MYIMVHRLVQPCGISTLDQYGSASFCFYICLVHHETGLSPPVKYFTGGSKAWLLLLIVYVISVLFCYAFVNVCLLMPCGHLLGKG